MSVISDEIFEQLCVDLMKELKKRNYKYSEDTIRSILDLTFTRKKDVIEILSKHPNWNPEKLMIQFDADYTRELDFTNVQNFRNYLFQNLMKEYNVEEPYFLSDKIKNIVFGITEINTQYLDPSYDHHISVLNSLNDNFKIRNNMKTSKVIGKVCKEMGWDQFPDYQKEYAKVCDALNPIRVKRHTCISLNPLDYFLMSNGNSWNSCHYIGDTYKDRHCSCSGSMSYMLDPYSFVFYTVSADFNGEDIELEPKLQRQIFAYSDEMLFQSRLYPQANDSGAEHIYKEIREIVQKVVADCLDKPNLWKTSHSAVSDIIHLKDGATAYPDWHDGNPGCKHCKISTFLDNEFDLSKNIILGELPICLKCGESHNYTSDFYDDDSCRYDYKCSCCGVGINEGSERLIIIDGVAYCTECMRPCDICGAFHLANTMSYDHTNHAYVCDECLNRDYIKCEDCGRSVRKDQVYTDEKTGKNYCRYCRDWNTSNSKRSSWNFIFNF